MLMQFVTRATSIATSLLIMSGEIIPFHGWGLWVIGGSILMSVLVFIICIKHAEKINAIFDKIIDKLQGKIKRKTLKTKK